ncbi:KAT8 regulatory NSL complex subunit 1-like isoform X2 [Oscarella lobularis]|uniref:KAT8 regulatory NSL complex subunit 1-like isoform X2 n=1 Tax=Oscarella lobularis TaxID=121494 RepID=UPI003313BDE8
MLATAALCLLGHCMAAPAEDSSTTTSRKMSPPPPPPPSSHRNAISDSSPSPTTSLTFVTSSFRDRNDVDVEGAPYDASDRDCDRHDECDEARDRFSFRRRRRRRRRSEKEEEVDSVESPILSNEFRRRSTRYRDRRSALRARVRSMRERLAPDERERVRERVASELDDFALDERSTTRGRFEWARATTKGDARIASDSLRRRFERIRRAEDADETESSSGGDDDSDWIRETPVHERKKPILRTRADLVRRQWDEDRACIGAHWQLLHARISDQEYRIRKQTELCEKLDAERASVTHARPPLETVTHAKSQTDRERKVVPINGSSMVLLLMKEDDDDDGEETMQCARAIPLESAPRRRIICGNLTSHDNDDDEEDATIVATQPINVQLSNLDYSFHPRLSLLTDASLPLLLHASVRHERWLLAKGIKRKSRYSAGSERKRSFLSNSASAAMLQYERDSLSSSFPSGALKRRRSTAFDINAIVIPNSFFSTTRVEKIHYEEIVTPKWRNNELKTAAGRRHANGLHPRHQNHKEEEEEEEEEDEDFEEDLSEEAFAARHSRAEAQERKRYMSWYKKGNHKTAPTAAATAAASPSGSVTGSTLISVGEPLTLESLNNGRGCLTTYQKWAESVEKSGAFAWPRRRFPIAETTYRAMLAANEIHGLELLSTRAKNYSNDERTIAPDHSKKQNDGGSSSPPGSSKPVVVPDKNEAKSPVSKEGGGERDVTTTAATAAVNDTSSPIVIKVAKR